MYDNAASFFENPNLFGIGEDSDEIEMNECTFLLLFAPPLPPVADQILLIAHGINIRNKLPSSFGPPRTHLILLRMDRLWLVVLRRVRRRKLR